MLVKDRCKEAAGLLQRNDGAADHKETAATLMAAADLIEQMEAKLEATKKLAVDAIALIKF